MEAIEDTQQRGGWANGVGVGVAAAVFLLIEMLTGRNIIGFNQFIMSF